MVKILMLSIFLITGSYAHAENSNHTLNDFYEQKFKELSVTETTVGPKAELLWKNDKKAKKYKTRLLEEWNSAKEPNFADHYFAVPDIGCGTGCAIIFIVDWNTGRIYHAPEDHAFAVRKNSRLLILKPYEDCTAYGPPMLFEFKDSKFTAIKHDKCR